MYTNLGVHMESSYREINDWSKTDKPMTKDYQPSNKEFAGMGGETLNYIGRRDRTQNAAASKVRSQEYRGRYS